METRTDLEVADIFRQYFDDYKKKYKTPVHIERIVKDIVICRTAALGGHVEIYEDCGHMQISYNSCRNRHCPKCQFIKKEKWVLDKQKDVLPVQYFHVVFTVPDKLNLLMYRNKKVLYNLLMKCSGKTITELEKNPDSLMPEQEQYVYYIHGLVTDFVCCSPMQPEARNWICIHMYMLLYPVVV